MLESLNARIDKLRAGRALLLRGAREPRGLLAEQAREPMCARVRANSRRVLGAIA